MMAAQRQKGFYKLVGNDADGLHFEEVIKMRALTLGRARSNHVPQTMGIGTRKTLSREHLKFEWNNYKGIWQLSILGRAGARINGEKIDSDCGPVILQSNDLIEAEGARLKFLLPKGSPVPISVPIHDVELDHNQLLSISINE
jgi:hypothetical protein